MTRKQQLFIEYYLQSRNGSQSAKKAGYSPKTAIFIARENLQKPYIKEEIDRRFKEIQERLQITDGRIIEELWKIATNEKEKTCDRVSAMKELASIRGMKTVKLEQIGDFKPPPVFYNKITLPKPADRSNSKDTLKIDSNM